jgi:acetyltransferase-like isoleucine patch superfamily enzyme
MTRLIYRLIKKVCEKIYFNYCHILTRVYFKLNNVVFNEFVSLGVPLLDIHPKGKCQFNSSLILINNARFATLGKNNRCKIVVSEGARLIVGEKVGMSNTTIVATSSIIIGNNIVIGGGTVIVDSDFHSLNPYHWHTKYDVLNMRKSPVIIKDNVFIGMNCIILKGVTIGFNVIIGAGSVVSQNIPDNEIWGGNPAKFIRKNNFDN